MKQHGIALIQVLLITTILTLLALFITSTAREQVAIAQDFSDKANALVLNYDAEAELLFSLLTEKKGIRSQELTTELPVTQKWNFHGGAFNLLKSQEIRLQDLRGLLNIHYPNHERWVTVLTYHGLSNYDAHRLINLIKDIQDLDSVARYGGVEHNSRNGAIQFYSELDNYVTKELVEVIERVSTQYNKGMFNPMTAPDDLIQSLYSDSVANQVLLARNQGQLNARKFTDFTGITEGRSITLFPSNNYRLDIRTVSGNAKERRVLYYQLRPSKPEPVNLVLSEG